MRLNRALMRSFCYTVIIVTTRGLYMSLTLCQHKVSKVVSSSKTHQPSSYSHHLQFQQEPSCQSPHLEEIDKTNVVASLTQWLPLQRDPPRFKLLPCVEISSGCFLTGSHRGGPLGLSKSSFTLDRSTSFNLGCELWMRFFWA
jgi:hypothetical protein